MFFHLTIGLFWELAIDIDKTKEIKILIKKFKFP
tara:strand:- start:4 stop:105 length:102 start_codon:yes stop_codon:yes gene_type:complete